MRSSRDTRSRYLHDTDIKKAPHAVLGPGAAPAHGESWIDASAVHGHGCEAADLARALGPAALTVLDALRRRVRGARSEAPDDAPGELRWPRAAQRREGRFRSGRR